MLLFYEQQFTRFETAKVSNRNHLDQGLCFTTLTYLITVYPIL